MGHTMENGLHWVKWVALWKVGLKKQVTVKTSSHLQKCAAL